MLKVREAHWRVKESAGKERTEERKTRYKEGREEGKKGSKGRGKKR